MVRPHILLAIILGSGLAMMFGSKGMKAWMKVSILIFAMVMFFFISGDVIEYAGTEDLNVFKSDAINKRAGDLSRTGSGVDISNYNQVMKLFTFWFRPLFVDSPNALGYFTSIENLLVLVLFVKGAMMLLTNFMNLNGWFKILLFFFLLASVALAQVMSNLGIAMRQKAQIIVMFYIIYAQLASMNYQKKLLGGRS